MIPRGALLLSLGLAITFGIATTLQATHRIGWRQVAFGVQIASMAVLMFWLGYSMGTPGK